MICLTLPSALSFSKNNSVNGIQLYDVEELINKPIYIFLNLELSQNIDKMHL